MQTSSNPPNPAEITYIDTSILEFYKRMRDSLEEEDGKVSVLVKLYDEEYAKKVRYDLAF